MLFVCKYVTFCLVLNLVLITWLLFQFINRIFAMKILSLNFVINVTVAFCINWATSNYFLHMRRL